MNPADAVILEPNEERLPEATEPMVDPNELAVPGNPPLSLDFARNPKDREVMELYFGQKVVARPVLAPPGVPADRLKALRAAFDAMGKSSEFRNAAVASKLELNPTSYEAVEKVIGRIAATPPDIAKRFAEATAPRE